MAITAAPTLIRSYCRPIATDTTNWPDATLNTWWDRAHERVKQLLCPPFTAADIEALNSDSTNSDSGDDLVARVAAVLIFESLPGGNGGAAYENLRRDLYGGTLPDGATTVTGFIEQLQTGAASLFDASGTALARTPVAYHSLESIPDKTFSRTGRSNGTIIGDTGTLDQYDQY